MFRHLGLFCDLGLDDYLCDLLSLDWMSNLSLATFFSPSFLILFLYCCLLQYQIIQLSHHLPPPISIATHQTAVPDTAFFPTTTTTTNTAASSPPGTPPPPPPPPPPPITTTLRAHPPWPSYSSSHPLERSRGIREEVFRHRSPPPLIPPKISHEEEQRIHRDIYGGKYDPVHLGGFTARDNDTISTNLWNFLISEFAVKSMIDVGCGKGFSSKFFYDHGVKVLCVEGSRDAVQQSLLPMKTIIQHDYSLGPWWPEETYDLVWSTEFVEHVGRQYMANYLATFHKAAIIMITSSGWGGWHHVEVHAPWWWRARMLKEGFLFSPELTERIHKEVDDEGSVLGITAQHLGGMQVFINPFVASLPQHRHLIGGHGCYNGVIDNQDGGKACDEVKDVLPKEYQSLIHCKKEENKLDMLWSCQKNPTASGVY
eukprot:gene7488-8277_t